MVVKSGLSIKGHCPTCGRSRNAAVVAHHEDQWQDEEGDMWGRGDYRILKCAGCDQIYFQQETFCSEDADKETTYWPAPSKRKRPEWLWEIDDSALGDLLTVYSISAEAQEIAVRRFVSRCSLRQSGSPRAPEPQKTARDARRMSLLFSLDF
jgi:hypothetical protein